VRQPEESLQVSAAYPKNHTRLAIFALIICAFSLSFIICRHSNFKSPQSIAEEQAII
jgi:hypothetical protein